MKTTIEIAPLQKEISYPEIHFVRKMSEMLAHHLCQRATICKVNLQIHGGGGDYTLEGTMEVKICATHRITLAFKGTMHTAGHFFGGEWSISYDDGEIKAVVDHDSAIEKGWEQFRKELGITP